jgi:hypothetical protein
LGGHDFSHLGCALDEGAHSRHKGTPAFLIAMGFFSAVVHLHGGKGMLLISTLIS